MDYNDLANDVDSTYWYFAGKNDMLELLARRYFRQEKNIKILDIGCGTGDDIQLLSKFGIVFGIEHSSEAITNCIVSRKLNKVTRSDAEELNFKDNVFDCVVMLDVLEHLKNDTKAIKEIYRVLKKNGIAIISVPAHQMLWSGHDEALGHIRRYSKKELRFLINCARFSIEKLTFWNTLMFCPVAIVRIFRRITNSGKTKPDVKPLPKPINTFLKFLLTSENKILKYADSPCGISLFAVIVKK